MCGDISNRVFNYFLTDFINFICFSRDPYLDKDNDNWQLGVPNKNNNNKKGKDFEMKGKTSKK